MYRTLYYICLCILIYAFIVSFYIGFYICVIVGVISLKRCLQGTDIIVVSSILLSVSLFLRHASFNRFKGGNLIGIISSVLISLLGIWIGYGYISHDISEPMIWVVSILDLMALICIAYCVIHISPKIDCWKGTQYLLYSISVGSLSLAVLCVMQEIDLIRPFLGNGERLSVFIFFMSLGYSIVLLTPLGRLSKNVSGEYVNIYGKIQRKGLSSYYKVFGIVQAISCCFVSAQASYSIFDSTIWVPLGIILAAYNVFVFLYVLLGKFTERF